MRDSRGPAVLYIITIIPHKTGALRLPSHGIGEVDGTVVDIEDVYLGEDGSI